MPVPDEACANPQLLGWVKEWLDLARERNSKGVITYKHAYDSLKACPITFQHPAELQQLRGYGPKLCERLTQKLQQFCAENGRPMPKKRRARIAERDLGLAAAGSAPPSKRTRVAKPYVPAFRSGAYALVLALSTLDEDATVGMTKVELVEVAQPHCDSSFTAPSDPTKFYTAWNSMKTLLDKDLVYERGRPLRRYYLTDEGWEVFRRIRKVNEQQGRSMEGFGAPELEPEPEPLRPRAQRPPLSPGLFIDDIDDIDVIDAVDDFAVAGPSNHHPARKDVVADGPATDGESPLPKFRPIHLQPGSFTVHLLLDVREIRAKTDRDYMQEELTKLGVKPIMRSLELGDAQWVAKCHDAGFLARHGAEGDEVVLDWIVERKRLDDLVASIKDGRFHEQKFRLQRSGVRNVVYIVEEIAMDAAEFQKYEEAVQTAIAGAQVADGYFVKKTQRMDETIRYLARMTALLKRRYESRLLSVIPTAVLTAQNYLPLLRHLREAEPAVGHYVSYDAFASLASKSDMITLRDLFLKMLMTTRGVTGEKAIEIQKRWRTPHEFVRAFEACGPGEAGRKRKQDMVSGALSHLVGRKKIAKAVSQRIAEVWADA